jgi:hypothetical protein
MVVFVERAAFGVTASVEVLETPLAWLDVPTKTAL